MFSNKVNPMENTGVAPFHIAQLGEQVMIGRSNNPVLVICL